MSSPSNLHLEDELTATEQNLQRLMAYVRNFRKLLALKEYPCWAGPAYVWDYMLHTINVICMRCNLPTFSPGAKYGYEPHFTLKLSPAQFYGQKADLGVRRRILKFEPVSDEAKEFMRVVEQVEIEYQLTH